MMGKAALERGATAFHGQVRNCSGHVRAGSVEAVPRMLRDYAGRMWTLFLRKGVQGRDRAALSTVQK